MSLETLSTLAPIATFFGVLLAVRQLWLTKQQAITTFEDQLAAEYRQLARLIPVPVFMNEQPSSEESRNIREYIYNYIDLSNEQIFLRKIGRIRKNTWEYWQEGIKANLDRAMFKSLWNELKDKAPELFTELQELEKRNFVSDPFTWDRNILQIITSGLCGTA